MTFPSAGLRRKLASAISSGEIVPHFQPIVGLSDRKIVGFEILARWHVPQVGYVPPTQFIPMIEKQGMLDALLDTLMDQALCAARSWPSEVFLAFNLSPKQLHNSGLPSRISINAEAAGFPTSRLHFEITETAIMDEERASAVLKQLCQIGCHVAIDDFGTGYSCLAWLQRLPVSKIKIDTIFVNSMLEQKESRKIVNAVVGLGHSLGLAVVAEGVEREAQAEFLNCIGCNFAQGFLFGKPSPAADISGLLAKYQHRVFGFRHTPMSLEQRAYQISALYRGNDMAIGFLDADGVLVDGSESLMRRLGLTRETSIGRSVEDIAAPSLDFVARLEDEQKNRRNYTSAEVRLPSGQADLMIAQDVRDEGGESIGTSILAIDITEIKQVKEELSEHRKQFRFVAENCPHALWVMSPEGKIKFSTPYWEKISGISKEEVENGEMAKFIDPEHCDLVLSRWRHCFETGETFDMDYRQRLADGDLHWVRCWGAPHRDQQGNILAWYGTFSLIEPPRSLAGELVSRGRHLNIPDGDRISSSLRLASLLRISADVLSQLYDDQPDLQEQIRKVAATIEQAAVAGLA